MGRPKLSDEERKQRIRERDRLNRLNNKDKHKQYCLDNKDKIKSKREQYYLDNKDKIRANQNEWFKQRRQSNPVFKLQSSIRTSIFKSLQRQGYTKQSSTSDILGCTWDEFKQHIESQFEPWMHWSNCGGREVLGPNMTWDLDHITPISSAVTEDDVKRLNHYTNFQPLCSYVNRFVKRDNV